MYEAHLLRRSYREGGKVKNETLANLSQLPREAIERSAARCAGEPFLVGGRWRSRSERSLPHGQVAGGAGDGAPARAGAAARPRPVAGASLVLAMICQRLLAPGSKLADVRALAQSTLAEELGGRGRR